MHDLYGKVNARHIRYSCAPQLFRKHTLSYYYSVANENILGPEDVVVIRNSGGDEEHFERILRIILRVPNTSMTSWSIFKPERTWKRRTRGRGNRFVLRHSTWDAQTDMATQAWKQRVLPALSTISWYIEEKNCDQIIRCCQRLDTLLVQGISFPPRTSNQVAWKELAVVRALDWGAIELVWHQSRENVDLEQVVFAVAEAIEQMLQKHRAGEQVLIDTMEMVFPGGTELPGLYPDGSTPGENGFHGT